MICFALLQKIFLSTNIGYEKPRVEIFRGAIKRAGNPKESYMIGDNPVTDIEGALKASIQTILVHNDRSDVPSPSPF